MAVSPPVSALPWYDRRDYPALLKLFSDPHMATGDLRRMAQPRRAD